jgi:HAD superfamily hydrolase (TIGR01509 family)
MTYRGFIFDLDGTLVDNIPLHMEAFATFCARHGLPPLSEEKRARIDGKRNHDVFPIVFERPLSDADVRRFADEKESLYRKLSRGRLAPRRGLLRLLDELAEMRERRLAVATSAPAENVAHSLAELGLAGRFAHVVRSDEVARGKPSPDVFIEAAKRIGVPPAACVVFEDAPAGILGARNARMTCVAVGSTHSLDMLREHGAQPHFLVSDFEEYLNGPGAAHLMR